MKSGLAFIALLILLIAGCNKPPGETFDYKDSRLAVTFSASLKDTLPEKTFHALGIKDVTGVRLLDLAGNDIRYFSYHVDAEKLIYSLSLSPFSIFAPSADTICRRVHRSELVESCFRENELTYATLFLEAGDESEIYESIKPPLRHIIIVNRKSRSVLHRISNS